MSTTLRNSLAAGLIALACLLAVAQAQSRSLLLQAQASAGEEGGHVTVSWISRLPCRPDQPCSTM
jgi:hypothetical protein